jgi:enoyl-CoA hydratase/carnithine racemase
MITESPVLFERLADSAVAVATLNRPKQLNALTLEMCQLLLAQLQTWAVDDSVRCVVLRGAGEKGFCAGGDVAEVIRGVRAGGDNRFNYGDAFFTVEYALDLLIHTYPKPLIALSHGVCMGGGVGLIAGASHRVFVAGSKIAMPEIHIGLFPDVGGGFFLNTMPDGIGYLMALTGMIVTESDAAHAGLADHVIGASAHEKFLHSLECLLQSDDPAQNHLRLSAHLTDMEQSARDPVSTLATFAEDTRELTNAPNVIAYRDALSALAAREPYFASAAKNLNQGSPTAAHVTFEYLQRSKSLEIDEVLALDLILAKQFQRHHDFTEGVRALLIDKDKTPKWSPPNWGAISQTLVNAHFAGLA